MVALFLCIFFPPVIAVALAAKIRKENFSNKQYFTYYAVFAVIINGIMFWILHFFFSPFALLSPSAGFLAKYISLSSLLSVVLAYITESFRKFKPLSTDMIQEEETQENTDEDEQKI